MLELTEIQREAQESFADLDIPWETGRGVPSPTIRESLCESRAILEELYVKLYNGESAVQLGNTALGYGEREKYCDTIAEELFQIYTLIEMYDRINAVEGVLASV